MGEEILFRGYLMMTLARKTNIWVAIILSSLTFAAFHTGNAAFSFIAFLNIFLFGVFAAVYMLKRGSIWGACAIHTAWNFIQGNVLGFSVSGTQKLESLLEAKPNGFGSILHGGEFGLEGGLGATVILLIALLCALTMPTKKSEIVEEPTDTTEEPA
jgi:membrane protease YdiL (CAAX protease family)